MSAQILKDGRALTLRPAAPDDAAALLDFHRIVGGETDYLNSDENGLSWETEESERTFLERRLHLDNSAMWLGFIDGEMAAMCSVDAEQKPRIRHNACLGIAVQRKYWHTGAGSALMETMLAFARRRETLKRLWLEVRSDNTRAIALYERFGFRACGCAHRFLRAGDDYFDMLLMELWL